MTIESSDLTAPATDSNDWRVRVSLSQPGAAAEVTGAQSVREVESELEQRVRGRVVLDNDGDCVFLYTSTRDGSVAAQQAVSDVLAEHGVPAQIVIERWHPVAEQWEPQDVPLPADEAAARAERAPLDAEETRESLAMHAAMYEVRVDLPSHGEAVELAARLKAEGYSVVRRWRFVVAGANNADQAADFEAAIRKQAPEGAHVSVYSHLIGFQPRYDL